MNDNLTMNTKLPSLTVVMPCLNEEENVALAAKETLAAFDRHRIEGELIIVNDGSSDRTGEIARELQQSDSRVRVLTHENRLGIGASFRDGVQAARGDYCTWIPGDNENDPDDVMRYYYMTRDVDIIVPFIHNIEVRSWSRRIISSLYRFIINMSFGTNLNYTNGTVIYNTAILRDTRLCTKGFFYQAEILIRLIRAGYLYAETPQFLGSRDAGKTKALSLKSFLDVAKSYLFMLSEVHILHRVPELGDDNLNPKSVTYARIRDLRAQAARMAQRA